MAANIVCAIQSTTATQSTSTNGPRSGSLAGCPANTRFALSLSIKMARQLITAVTTRQVGISLSQNNSRQRVEPWTIDLNSSNRLTACSTFFLCEEIPYPGTATT